MEQFVVLAGVEDKESNKDGPGYLLLLLIIIKYVSNRGRAKFLIQRLK